MATFKCLVIEVNGKKNTIVCNAESKAAAIQTVKSDGQTIVAVDEVDTSKDIKLKGYIRKFKSRDLSIFCRQMNAMLAAGLPISSCLEILSQQLENKKLKAVVDNIYESILKGYTFSEAVAVHSSVFPEIFLHMVEAGELSGNLDVIMDRLAAHFEKEYKIESKVKNAMVYPAVLASLSVVVVVFLLVFVLPTFMDIYTSSGAQLPTITRVFIAISNFIRYQWYICLAFAFIIAVILNYAYKNDDFRISLDRRKLNIPIFKAINRNAPAARFARTMSTLMGSGVPLIQALDISGRITGNRYISSKLVAVREEVKRGVSLYVPLKAQNIFPYMLSSMVKIGEDSGTLEEILDKTADFYEGEVENSVQKLTAILEPLMIIVMALLVGFIVLAMVVPMFDMLNVVV